MGDEGWVAFRAGGNGGKIGNEPKPIQSVSRPEIQWQSRQQSAVLASTCRSVAGGSGREANKREREKLESERSESEERSSSESRAGRGMASNSR